MQEGSWGCQNLGQLCTSGRKELVIELSNAMGYNFVELYLPQLHAHLRPTAAERALQQQLAEQAAQLQRITEERDRYWKVIEGKAG